MKKMVKNISALTLAIGLIFSGNAWASADPGTVGHDKNNIAEQTTETTVTVAKDPGTVGH